MVEQAKLVRDQKLTDDDWVLQIVTWLTGFFLIFLVVAFFKGWLQAFYVNILFGFYALTHTMWASVVLLGVMQTLIMVPFRMVRVALKQNTQKFQDKMEEIRGGDQMLKMKKSFKQGNLTFQFYLVDFMVQLTLFISIGRLFLTDFYSVKIDPSLFLNWIPYPEYPLQGLFFKIPYPYITNYRDLGWWAVAVVWALILLGHVFLYLGRRMQRRFEIKQAEQEAEERAKAEEAGEEVEDKSVEVKKKSRNRAVSILGGSTIVMFIIAYFVVRRFPLNMELRIFSGDVSIPNRTLNTVTAIVTFITFAWFGIMDLYRQGRLAEEKGIPKQAIDATQQEMFRDAIFNSALIGLGAYYITNLIPSAFELSIFTFELIAILSPFTLDKFVLKIRDDED